jgi:hypothetical protein
VQASVKEPNVESSVINQTTSARALLLSPWKAIWRMILFGLVHAKRYRWKAKFDGKYIGPMCSPRSGERYNGARLSMKAIASIKGAIRTQLRNGNQASWAEVVSRLNRTVLGWAAYFCYGSLAKARHDVHLHLDHSVRRFLRRRHKVAGPGYRQFPVAAVFVELGALAPHRLPRLASANAARETPPRAG